MSDTKANEKAPPGGGSPENVWTYRGYRMKPGEFNTAMVHFYRGEITRSNVWRSRLDSTTNWAVVTAGAVLTFAFGSPENSHVVILISFMLVWLFLAIEARRYRYYELWALRVRLMETDFFAAMFNPPYAPHREWASRLVDNLISPEFPISYLEAIGRRLRRNYIWLFLILGLAWALKLMLYPGAVYSITSFIDQARIGLIPGNIVALAVTLFFFVIFLIAVLTSGLQDSPGEVLSRHEALDLSSEFFHSLAHAASQVLPEEISFLHRREQLAIIITGKAEEVSQQLLSLLNRGVTALQGKGMYTGQPRSVLLCAVSPSEVTHLKELVYALDEDAFVVVNPTEEVWGAGFRDLQPRWKKVLQKVQERVAREER
jgi:uncharacterized membrane protein